MRWLLGVIDRLGFWALACVVMFLAYAALRLWLNRRSHRSDRLRPVLSDGAMLPRNQHYYFAHGALRALAGEAPDQVVLALGAPDADAFLRRVWDDVAAELSSAGQEGIGIDATGLEAISARVAGRPCAVVKLPEPQAATEAHFVAIVLNHEVDEPAPSLQKRAMHYFTLEMGLSPGGGPATVFCEWVGDSHRNHGDGPPPDARAFLDHIARFLGRPAPHPSAVK